MLIAALLLTWSGSAFGQVAVTAPGLDGRFKEITQHVRGFGGYFFDQHGDLHAFLTDPSEQPAAEAVLAGLAASPRPEQQATKTPAIIFEQAQYDFEQLLTFRDALRPVLTMPNVQFIDTDEEVNRVTIGVTSADAAAAVQTFASALQIPRAAYGIEITSPVERSTSLSDYIRPLEGGIKITSSGSCTLGANVLYSNWAQNISSASGFFTASHCSSAFGSTEGTVFSQGGVQIGVERWDPPTFTNADNSLCPLTAQCRWSDVTFVQFSGGTSYQLGRIAQTLWRGLGSGSANVGSTEINSGAPQFTINSGTDPVVGNYVDKVGIATGWTSGTVRRTCADYSHAGNVILLCQDEVNAYATNGDSGSPVFAYSTGNSVSIVGFVLGQAAGRYLMSSTHGVARDFGSAVTYF